MKTKTKVEIGALAVCAALLGGSTIAVNEANKGKHNYEYPTSSYTQQIEQSEQSELPTEATAVPAVENTTAVPTKEPTAEAQPTVEPAETEPPETTTTAAMTTTPPETTVITTAAPPETTAATTSPDDVIVYIAASGEGTKYHRDPKCSRMDGVIEITRREAKAAGYGPCGRCYR